MPTVTSSSRRTISPGEIERAAAAASSRAPIYVDYLLWLSEAGAKRVTIALVLCLLGLELLLHVWNPMYARTSVSSLHGIRAIFQQAEDDPRRKYLAFGDSTLVGGGVANFRETVLGLWVASGAPHAPVYNLAVPSGDSVTSALLLDRVTRSRISNVAGVIIEVMPSKFVNEDGLARMSANRSKDTIAELQHLVPGLEPGKLGLESVPTSLSDRVEVEAQWQLAHHSRIFRHRDWTRTEVMGNYPILWAIGATLPKKVFQIVFPARADGVNSLGANLEDAPFDPAHLRKVDNQMPRFAPEDQTSYVRRCIASARAIHAKPLLLCFPMHVEAYDLRPEARRGLYACVAQFNQHIQQFAREEGVDLLFCPSDSFQDPALWTRTPAHFNERGSRAIWDQFKAGWIAWEP